MTMILYFYYVVTTRPPSPEIPRCTMCSAMTSALAAIKLMSTVKPVALHRLPSANPSPITHSPAMDPIRPTRESLRPAQKRFRSTGSRIQRIATNWS